MFWTGLNCSATSQVPWVSPYVPAGEIGNLTTVSSAVAVCHRKPDRRSNKTELKTNETHGLFLLISFKWRNFHELQNQAVSQGVKLKTRIFSRFPCDSELFKECLYDSTLFLRTFQWLRLKLNSNTCL